MSSIKEVRVALAAQIQRISGITCKSFLSAQINPPVATIGPGTPYAKYGITLGDAALGIRGGQVLVPTELNIAVDIWASIASGYDRAQEQVDQYLGLESDGGIVSVPMAILSDPTLGGVVEYCEPLLVNSYGITEYANQQYFRGRITVQVSVTQDLGA